MSSSLHSSSIPTGIFYSYNSQLKINKALHIIHTVVTSFLGVFISNNTFVWLLTTGQSVEQNFPKWRHIGIGIFHGHCRQFLRCGLRPSVKLPQASLYELGKGSSCYIRFFFTTALALKLFSVVPGNLKLVGTCFSWQIREKSTSKAEVLESHSLPAVCSLNTVTWNFSTRQWIGVM